MQLQIEERTLIHRGPQAVVVVRQVIAVLRPSRPNSRPCEHCDQDDSDHRHCEDCGDCLVGCRCQQGEG